jgi:hypothetical protein
MKNSLHSTDSGQLRTERGVKPSTSLRRCRQLCGHRSLLKPRFSTVPSASSVAFWPTRVCVIVAFQPQVRTGPPTHVKVPEEDGSKSSLALIR